MDIYTCKKNRPFLFERLLKVIPFCPLLHLHPLYFVSAFQFKINSGVAGAEFQIFNVIFKISPHHNLIHTLQFIYFEDFQIKYIAPSSWVGFLIVAIINNHGRVRKKNPTQENNKGRSYKDCVNFSNLRQKFYFLSTGLLGNKKSL